MRDYAERLHQPALQDSPDCRGWAFAVSTLQANTGGDAMGIRLRSILFSGLLTSGAIGASGCQDIDQYGPGKLAVSYLPSTSVRYDGLGALAVVREAFDTRQLQPCEGIKLTGLGWSCPGGKSARWSAAPVVSIIQYGDTYAICMRAYASESCAGNVWRTLCNAAASRSGCQPTDPAGAPGAKRAVDGILILALSRSALTPEQDKAFVAAADAALGAPDLEERLTNAVETRRRVQRQVDTMLANQRDLEAAKAYADYLASDPLWAQGHYNNAVVLAGLELYPDAIAAAQKSVYLEADGPSARIAKDSIYQWEAMLALPTK